MHSKTLLSIAVALALPNLLQAEGDISLKKTDKALILLRGDTPVLTYHTAEVPPPDGVDPSYNRSGFIHPMHAPAGGVVTGIHPDDHYHHIGLWHAWVNTNYRGGKPDFWNLGKKTGLIRHTGIVETRDRGFTVSQEQAAFLDKGKSEATPVIGEELAVDASFIDGANVIDYVLTQTNVTGDPIEFPAYRYGGGIAYRGPLTWNKSNSDYLTSEGKDRTNSHATRADWVAMFGPADGEGDAGGDATVLIMCHPENHDSPQRVRTWDNGKMFLNYVPVQETAWAIKPKESVVLRYRIVIFDGKPDKAELDKHWKAYSG